MIRQRPEQQLHKCVAAYMALLPKPPVGPFWTHPANGFKRSKAEAGIAKAFGQKAGTPDIVGCFKGRFFAIELKARGHIRKLTPAQIAVHEQITLAGGIVATLDSLDDVIAFLDVLGIPTLKMRRLAA